MLQSRPNLPAGFGGPEPGGMVKAAGDDQLSVRAEGRSAHLPLMVEGKAEAFLLPLYGPEPRLLICAGGQDAFAIRADHHAPDCPVMLHGRGRRLCAPDRPPSDPSAQLLAHQQPASVRRERHRSAQHRRHQSRPARSIVALKTPEYLGLTPNPCQHRPSVRTEENLPHLPPMTQGSGERLARFRRPKSDGAVSAPGQYLSAVRAEEDRGHVPFVEDWAAHWISGQHVPEAGRLVRAPGEEPAAVRAEGERSDSLV